MIIETNDFEYKTLHKGFFLGVWPAYQVKRLREGERVSTVLTFSLFGLNFHIAKVSKRKRWAGEALLKARLAAKDARN